MKFTMFKKKCPVCNMIVDTETAIKKEEKYFCSENHAEQYLTKLGKEESKSTKGGSCCH